jgi:hypothetical protein
VADDIIVKNSAGEDVPMAADDVGGGRLAQIIKIGIGPDGQITFLSGNSGVKDAGTVRVTLATDDLLAAIADGGAATIDTVITRPADTSAYAAGDSWANATAGASVATIAGASRGASRSGLITDIMITLPVAPATALTGQLWIFNSSPTPLDDNAAWALADADLPKLVAVVDFTMVSTGSSNGNSFCHLTQLNIGFTTSGSADLFVIPKVTSAYVPSSSEAMRLKTKIVRSN